MSSDNALPYADQVGGYSIVSLVGYVAGVHTVRRDQETGAVHSCKVVIHIPVPRTDRVQEIRCYFMGNVLEHLLQLSPAKGMLIHVEGSLNSWRHHQSGQMLTEVNSRFVSGLPDDKSDWADEGVFDALYC